MDHYEVIIYWSGVDGVFIAMVPDLSGCMAHGATRRTALANAESAIAAWIATAREFGDPVPEAKAHRALVA
jgi:predicted RNase H-like HicB family nuclease